MSILLSPNVAANDIGGVEFMISPRKLGINDIKITARSMQAADAMIKTVIVEPEGVSREIVENLTFSGGTSRIVDTGIPPFVVEDSGRVYLAVTSSFLTQAIEGLEGLLRMPFGCGEQNMILFAPNAYITKYLRESGQLKPEIMAKAEKLMITGYQRQLTYRRRDGSFSAFGESDEATDWITAHQKADGSFESVGFVYHQEMMGGLSGKTALTAYVASRGEAVRRPAMPQSAAIEATAYAALALIEHGDAFNASRAARWLVSRRNTYGGYGSTQDTVVALQALTEYSSGLQADVDLRVTIVARVVEREETIKRYEVAGRKVIFYIENMLAGERISFSFDVQAMYPVRAKGVTSRVYSYYNPEISGVTLREGVVVGRN